MNNLNLSPSSESKMRSPDRILLLEEIEGKEARKGTTSSIIDPTLFKDGGNRLHCAMDPATCLWSFRYERGMIPPALRGTWTGFRMAKKFADEYFFHRNIRVSEVKD